MFLHDSKGEVPAPQFGPGSFAWMSRTSIPRFTIPSKTSRNGTMSRPPISTYISLMSARTLATFAMRKILARGLAAAPQFARTLLRLCFAKLLVLLVGGPDDFVAGASRAHPTRPLRGGRIALVGQPDRLRRQANVAIHNRSLACGTIPQTTEV